MNKRQEENQASPVSAGIVTYTTVITSNGSDGKPESEFIEVSQDKFQLRNLIVLMVPDILEKVDWKKLEKGEKIELKTGNKKVEISTQI